jgi:hypothetical protein
MTGKYKPLVRIIGIIVALASLTTIFYQLWQAWPQLQEVRIQTFPALLALLLICLNLTVAALLWRNILQRLGGNVNRPAAVSIWFVSQIVRYAPGNVWHLLGRVYLTNQRGIHAQSSSLSMVFELLHVITTGLLVATVSLFFWPQNVLGLSTLLLIPLAICYLWPRLLHYPLAWVLRRRGQHLPDLTIRRRDLLAFLPGYGCIWLIYGGSIYLLAASIYPLPLSSLPSITGIYAFAWVIGFLSFITPSGLGVREGVLGYLFSFLMPVPVALLLTILARVWMTVGELLCTIFVLWRKRLTHAG